MRFSLSALLDRLLAPAPSRARVGWLASCDYAHRGLHGGDVVENTLAAFAAAIAHGLGIELDVQRSRDDQAIVFHDDELGRLTGRAGRVTDMRAAALQTIPVGGGEPIPTLAQALALIAGRAPILVEIKVRDRARVQPLCLAVRRLLEGYAGPIAVMSFDPRVSRWFSRFAPHVVRGLIVTEDGGRTLSGHGRRHLALWHARPDFLAYDIGDLPSRFAAAQRARGLPLLTWTVNTPALAARAVSCADAAIAEGEAIGQVLAGDMHEQDRAR